MLYQSSTAERVVREKIWRSSHREDETGSSVRPSIQNAFRCQAQISCCWLGVQVPQENHRKTLPELVANFSMEPEVGPGLLLSACY